MSTAVFSLTSDNQFIRAKEGSEELSAHTYLDDLKDFELIRHEKQIKWSSPSTRVGATAAKFKELEVLGVTIGGDQLKELINDLTVPGDRAQLWVNRRGLCLLYIGGKSIKRLRINDRFGWSKYGVEPSVESGTTWSVWDMSSGAVLVDGERWEKVAEEKEKEMEEKEALLRKKLEEKEKEVNSLKAALNALTMTTRD